MITSVSIIIYKEENICYNTFEYLKYSLPEKAVSPKGGGKMNKYELMFIVRSDREEKEIKETAAAMKKILTDEKAHIIEEKEMGQKELAYEINKMKTGYYFLYVVETTPEVINEFERISRINENILRHLTIKVED